MILPDVVMYIVFQIIPVVLCDIVIQMRFHVVSIILFIYMVL